jgi:hypothetical protein
MANGLVVQRRGDSITVRPVEPRGGWAKHEDYERDMRWAMNVAAQADAMHEFIRDFARDMLAERKAPPETAHGCNSHNFTDRAVALLKKVGV